MPAPSVEALDGAGAGDAFIAGSLAARLCGLGALCVGAPAGVTGWDDALELAQGIA